MHISRVLWRPHQQLPGLRDDVSKTARVRKDQHPVTLIEGKKNRCCETERQKIRDKLIMRKKKGKEGRTAENQVMKVTGTEREKGNDKIETGGKDKKGEDIRKKIRGKNKDGDKLGGGRRWGGGRVSLHCWLHMQAIAIVCKLF